MDFIKTHLWVVLLFAASPLLALLSARVRTFVKDKFADFLGALWNPVSGGFLWRAFSASGYDLNDPKVLQALRYIVFGLVSLAEIKMPDDGMGADKKAHVTEVLTRIFAGKAQLADKAVSLIDDAAKALDGDMKDFIESHDPNK